MGLHRGCRALESNAPQTPTGSLGGAGACCLAWGGRLRAGASPGFLRQSLPSSLTLVLQTVIECWKVFPLAKMAQGKVLKLSEPKSRKISGQVLNILKASEIIEQEKKSHHLSIPIRTGLEQEERMVFERGIHYSRRLWHLNKSLAFCTSICLMNLAFVEAGSQTCILVTIKNIQFFQLDPWELFITLLSSYFPTSNL